LAPWQVARVDIEPLQKILAKVHVFLSRSVGEDSDMIPSTFGVSGNSTKGGASGGLLWGS
jgi:hypothetical protein